MRLYHYIMTGTVVDIPCHWIQMVKQSIGSIVPFFSSRRMLKEYIERMYIPAAQS